MFAAKIASALSNAFIYFSICHSSRPCRNKHVLSLTLVAILVFVSLFVSFNSFYHIIRLTG